VQTESSCVAGWSLVLCNELLANLYCPVSLVCWRAQDGSSYHIGLFGCYHLCCWWLQLRERLVTKLQHEPVLLVLDNLEEGTAAKISGAFLGLGRGPYYPSTRVLLISRDQAALAYANCVAEARQAMPVMDAGQARQLFEAVVASRGLQLPAQLIDRAVQCLSFDPKCEQLLIILGCATCGLDASKVTSGTYHTMCSSYACSVGIALFSN
jgi:hypothetical protein